MNKLFFGKIFYIAAAITLSSIFASAQPARRQDNKVRTVTIPISIFSKSELKNKRQEEVLEAGNLTVKEDGDEQVILSIREVGDTPLSLAVLVQDDLSSGFNLELSRLADFIRHLPRGSRVMVGYLRGGLQVRQRFTEDLEKAARALRIVAGRAVATADPFDGVSDAVQRFDALPAGRRAILLISDGFDTSGGFSGLSATRSVQLEQAILKAQRRSIAVYSFYSSATATENANSIVILNAQGSLAQLSEETGGRAFFQGTQSPISFDPFFKDLILALNRQFALSYLSTHMKKGYHKIQITSSNPQIKIEHPNGYFYR